jgi:hypothetical protein
MKGEIKMSMEKLLEEEIKTELGALKKLQLGEESHKTAVNSVTQLMDRAIELKKFEADAVERVRDREIETELKQQQMLEEKKDRFVRYLMTGMKDAAVFGGTIWAIVASMNFEKEGSITSSAGRKSLNKALSWFK